MASITDVVFEDLRALAYTGSLEDMQRQYLVDLADAESLSTEGTVTDLMVRLGMPVTLLVTIA